MAQLKGQSVNDVEHSAGATGNGPAACRDVQRHANRQIEMVPIAQLTPHPRNARTHSGNQVRQIAASIKRFGFCNPILVDDHNRIMAGHGRVEAAKQLELTDVPALRLSHLSEAEKRAYILADNKLAQKAGWDREILALELQGLIDLNFDIELTGFEAAEIDLILDEASEPKRALPTPDDDGPDRLEGPSVSRVGDMWLLGEHRILCGNGLDRGAYDQVLGGEKAEFVLIHRPAGMTPDALTEFLPVMFEQLDSAKDGSERNGIVIDPFMGSAPTVIAAQRAGRRARGIEIDPARVDVAIKQWQAFAGRAATLAATGQTFAEVETARALPSLPAPELSTRGAAAAKEAR